MRCVYADDISLLSPTGSGLQDMLGVCGWYTDHNLISRKMQ